MDAMWTLAAVCFTVAGVLAPTTRRPNWAGPLLVLAALCVMLAAGLQRGAFLVIAGGCVIAAWTYWQDRERLQALLPLAGAGVLVWFAVAL